MFVFVACRKTYNRILSRQELHKRLAVSKIILMRYTPMALTGVGF
jgi:hypothetical protein